MTDRPFRDFMDWLEKRNTPRPAHEGLLEHAFRAGREYGVREGTAHRKAANAPGGDRGHSCRKPTMGQQEARNR